MDEQGKKEREFLTMSVRAVEKVFKEVYGHGLNSVALDDIYFALEDLALAEET